MGVYIKGMEVPKSRGEYVFLLYVDSDGTATVKGAHSIFKGEPFEAVPAPPHGDLIGRNPLIDIAMHLRNRAKDEYTKRVMGSVIRYIAEAPTIIPAEEGET